jgi:hypothetical protein
MKRDEKTRSKNDDGEPPKKQEYLVIVELIYKPSDEIEDGHSLGIFVEVGRYYCGGGCVAGQGECRHITERLWYQHFHWTEERLGIDRPSTLGLCQWHPGGTALSSDVKQRIWEMQTVKHERSIPEQEAKMKRGVKRDCTEGTSCDYMHHAGNRKQQPQPGRFTYQRCEKFFKLLRK